MEEKRKMISFLVPCYNEQNNIEAMETALVEQMGKIPQYDYEIIFRDNRSTDDSLNVLHKVAAKNKRVKVIVNSRNYGLDTKNSFIGHVTGDLTITIPCDFQEPPELIPEFVSWWEKGYEIVCGQKTASEEGTLKYSLRQLFYKIIALFSEIPQYKNVSGIILMSRRIQEMYWKYAKNTNLRYFFSDIGYDMKLIPYKQKKRRSGKSSYNIWRSLSFAIDSLLSTSTAPLRMATLTGIFLSSISFIIGIVYLILKLIFWNNFVAGTAPLLIGMFFIGGIQLLFIGLVGEYVGAVLKKVTPEVPPVMKEMINYDGEDDFLVPSPDDSKEIK